MAKHKSMILIAAIAASCLVAGAGHAETKLTAEQVKTTCGTKLVNTAIFSDAKYLVVTARLAGFHVTRTARIAVVGY